MAQFLRPASDVSAGPWLPSTAGASLYSLLDESSADDTDFIYTPSAGVVKVALSAGTDPASSTGHIARYRAQGNGVDDLIVSLVDTSGPGTIASWTETAAAATVTAYSHTLSGAEADAIADYTALELWFELSSSSAGLQAPVTHLNEKLSDNSSPIAWTTSGSFTPQDNSLLTVVVGTLGNPGSDWTMTVSGGGLTWSERKTVIKANGAYRNRLSVWTAPVSTGASMQVTVTMSTSSTNTAVATIQAFSQTGYNTGTPTGATAP